LTLPSNGQITQLLKAWTTGDEEALAKLTPLIYGELHRSARRYMAHERAGHLLQTTALVNEVYIRLVDCAEVDWQDRAHFFAVSAQLMRRILVDFARERDTKRRGRNIPHISLDEVPALSQQPDPDLVALDDALTALAAIDERKSKTVELRFFGGLDIEQTAAVLKVSPKTVNRDWKMAKVWLLREMSGGESHGA
jgi:RNA polymerase sigma-70 factor (ECF subfamily)